MAEHVFSIMKEFVSGNTMDICCGVGAITLGLEKQANSMLGIELVSQAIEQAQKNAKRNNSKALFFTADMKHLKDYAPLEVDTIILDPPRAGVGKKPLKRILELEPKTIVYLSCNPKTQNSDLALIEELGGKYEIIYHKAFDFFPQTPHVESLVVLKKI
jgi:tRNA/tmRNA/rRNA uracil-C5-methylase (TrmA/RlmC/RlmD family)